MRAATVFLLSTLFLRLPAFAADPRPTFHVTRAQGPITIDGNLSDPGWQGALRVDQWWETNPGDNVEPKAKSVGYLTYDDHFLYAGFDFQDPNPSQIRAPFNDRDNINGNTDDYAGVIIDARNDGKTGVLFLATPRAIQYDSVSDDTTGNEDASPDFFWDAEAKINDHGWTLEIRIPFSSLRYKKADPQVWGIMLYRNWPRERRNQMFANQIPRGNNCFICNENKLTGLEGLPAGGHLVAAPYVSVKEVGETRDGLGTDVVHRPISGDGGLDVKWTPNADTAIDATLNPDFSQVESDAAVISTNERFAIFFPEKRPFFLEGSELFNTPIQAVYTRTITSPRWGLRSTGKYGDNAYTFLVTQDRGGGSVILPSSTGSDFADQEFDSTVAVGRVRHDFGKSFISALFADREVAGGAHNRVLGPDFQIKTEHHTLTGQLLLSDTKTPNLPDLADEWNGQKLRSHAGYLWYSYSNPKYDLYSEYKDYGDDFRADTGFVPEVGFRSNYTEVGETFRPKGFFSRIRTFAMGQYDSQQDGSQLYRLISGGFGADGKYTSFTRIRYAYDNVRNGDTVFQRHQLLWNISFSPPIPRVSQVGTSGWVGQDVDFTNNRLGRGAQAGLTATLRPTIHLQIDLSNSVRWLNVDAARKNDRLFTAQVERLRAEYTFNSKMFLRTILQNVRTNRDTALYIDEEDHHSGSFASQILFAYKLNWQTVMFVGAGDLREATVEDGDLKPSERQYFLKVSYAFQR